MNVLVTGSNGFIGRHVSRYLREAGNYIIGIGRRQDPVCKIDEYICCDMDSNAMVLLYDYMHVEHLDAVVHLAADMRKEPYGIEVVSHNCVGTQRILELCRQKNIKKFIQLSSLPVIGKPIIHPITEEHPLDPPTIYHVTKAAEEMLANYAYTKYGIQTISFRISAPVGIGMNPNTIFPTFVKKALRREELFLLGQGTRKQTYIHVDDISKAIKLALENNKAHGVYNLSSYNCLSNKELAEKCIEVLESKSKVSFSEKADYMDSYSWEVSLERIQKDFGYEPKISIEKAILEYANHLYRKEFM